MKVLFVASNPGEAETLELTREITDLQQRFAEAQGEPVLFILLPDIRAEALPGELAKHRPDVLHISAHGSRENLTLVDDEGGEVELDADMLKAFFPPDRVPRLVYINACESGTIAEALSTVVPVAIGSTAAISNIAARSGAVAFYERLLTGATVGQSFDVARHVTRLVSRNQTDVQIWWRAGIDPGNEILHRVPRLIADFVDGIPTCKRDFFDVRFGLVGCPDNTLQTVFFTDDEDMLPKSESSGSDEFEENEKEIESHLCLVVRRTPVNGRVWARNDEAWRIRGDFRLFAVGVTGDGGTFSLGSMLCEAIEHRYMIAPDHDVPADIAEAIVALRRENGAEVDYAKARRERMARSAVPADTNKPSATRARRVRPKQAKPVVAGRS